MTITAPLTAARARIKVNDSFHLMPVQAFDAVLERWPGRVFFSLPRWEGASKAKDLPVHAAREHKGKVQVFTGEWFGWREGWRDVPENGEEGYVYAR